MELRLYERPGPGPVERRGALRWLRWWLRRVEAFESWAAPEVAAEQEPEQERTLVPVAVLFGLALLAQLAQFSIPDVRAFLRDHDVLYRPSWLGFTIVKQWVLFVMMLVALRMKDEPLAAIGFPRLDARRLALGLGLVGFFLGVALLHRPAFPESAAARYWMTPYWPGERVLEVALALTAALVEETFFRGFAVTWTYRWSRHLPLAVVFPAVVFASGHAYLGWLNLAFAFLVALAFSGLFVWSRNLYWPMVIHFLLDVLELLR